MGCPKTKRISAYLDEELPSSERRAVEAHVQGCDRCGAALQQMRSLRSVFAARPRYQAPYGFATQVVAKAAGLGKEKSQWHVPLFVRFAEAVILLVVITVGILAGRVMTNSSPATTATSIASSLSLDLFDAAPPGSLGGAYLAMTEAGYEK